MCRFPKRDLRIARPRGPYTIKRSLGLTGGRPPKSQKVIADMERFIEKMVDCLHSALHPSPAFGSVLCAIVRSVSNIEVTGAAKECRKCRGRFLGAT